MKTNTFKTIFLSITLCLLSLHVYADTTKTIGTGDYPTLKAAFADINNGVITGAITLQITSSTTETASAVLNASGANGGLGTASYTTVLIYPTTTGLSISGALAAPLIDFNGADNVIIDGRVNQTGVKDLTISNTSATASTSTLRFIGGATNNTVQYTTIKGSETDAASGIIFFSTGANTGNKIDNSNITNSTDTNRPINAIYSAPATGVNSGVTISNNNIYDFLNRTTASNGIYLGANNSTWTILGNNFYETAVPATSFWPGAAVAYTVISITSGTGHAISGNFIGGNAASCAGTPWTKQGWNNTFSAISLTVGTGTATNVQGNTIQNISWANEGTAQWNAISITAGDVNIGTTAANTIGATTGTGSILVSDNSANTGTVYGIYITSGAGIINCQYNNIGSITAHNRNAAGGNSLYAIFADYTSSATTTFSNNIIGSTTTANSISSTSLATGNSQATRGIVVGSVNTTVNNNTVANLNNASTNANSNIFSIVSRGNAAQVITNNTIHDITGISSGQPVVGIYLQGNSTVRTVTGNTICNLSNTNTSFTGSYIAGVYVSQGATGTGVFSTYSNNFINNLTASSTSALVYGFKIDGGTGNFINNIISLGVNSKGSIYGIAETTALAGGNNPTLYYNTIYIGGAPTSGASNSYCFYSASINNARTLKNNLLVNARSNNGATGKHYAMADGLSWFTSDYNDYIASGTGGVLANLAATDVTTLAGIKAAVPSVNLRYGFDTNSLNTDPAFASPSTTAASYLPTVFTPATDVSIYTDFGGNTRTATSKMGALEPYVSWNGTTWSSSPTASLNAIINGTYNGAGFSCLDLTINAGKQTTITSGTLTVIGNLLLKSDAANGTATFIDNGGTLSVGANKTIVNQYLFSGRNWYVSSPMTNATSNAVAASATFPLYWYDETLASNNWTSINNTSVALTVLKGYVANPLSTGNINFTGGSLNTGAISVSNLSRSVSNTTKLGFNLVGNPYPSYLDWEDVNNTKTNLNNTIWYRTKSGSYYFETYNGTSHVGTNLSGNGAVTQYIPPMQAFWVRVDVGTGTLGFTNTARWHESGTNRLRAPALLNSDNQLLRLQVTNGVNRDEAIVLFNPNASNGFDNYDSPKMSNANKDIPEIYSFVESEQLVINGLKSISTNPIVPLGFSTGSSNSFTIKATELKNFDTDTRIILKDNLTNTEQDITDGTAYSFSSDITSTNSRFSIIFRSGSAITSVNSSIDNTISIFVFKNINNQIEVNIPDEIVGKASVYVYNSVGIKLESMLLKNSQNVLNNSYTAGVYLVSIITNGKSITRKIVIN